MSSIELNRGFNFELGFHLLAARFNQWKVKRQTRIELNRLSERELADIGFNRADIEHVVGAI